MLFWNDFLYVCNVNASSVFKLRLIYGYFGKFYIQSVTVLYNISLIIILSLFVQQKWIDIIDIHGNLAKIFNLIVIKPDDDLSP